MKADVQQILIWIGINAVLTFTISNISWQGHLGGFLGGVAIAAILVYAPRQRRTQVQVAGPGACSRVLLVAAIAARTASPHRLTGCAHGGQPLGITTRV